MKDKQARERLDDLERMLVVVDEPSLLFTTLMYKKSLRLESLEKVSKASEITELIEKLQLLTNHLGLEFEEKQAELIIKKKVK